MKNTLQALQSKRKSKKGFTLMEMLIVVAIIAILVAIAVPVFSAQLDKSKEQVDEANLRSAVSMAVIAYLTAEPAYTGSETFVAIVDNEDAHTMKIVNVDVAGTTPNYYSPKANTGKHIAIEVDEGGEVVSANWIS